VKHTAKPAYLRLIEKRVEMVRKLQNDASWNPNGYAWAKAYASDVQWLLDGLDEDDEPEIVDKIEREADRQVKLLEEEEDE
jgi:hypothetical protein